MSVQKSALLKSVSIKMRTTPHYRDIINSVGLGTVPQFESLPLSRPAEIRSNPQSFLPDNIDKKSLLGPFKTSGTTGSSKEIFFTKSDSKWIGEAYFDALGGNKGLITKDDILIVSALDREGSIGRFIAKEALPSAGYNSDICSALDPEALATRISTSKSEIVLLTGLPIILALMKIFKQQGLNPSDLPIKRMLIGGGVTSKPSVDLLIKYFGVDILGVYGMTETAAIVGVETYPNSGLYEFADNDFFYPELIRSEKYPNLKEVVLTILKREGTQLIRYGTQDMVRLHADGKFELVGRFDDEVVFGQMNFLWNAQTEQALEESFGFSEFAVELYQDEKGLDTFYFVTEREDVSERMIVGTFVDTLTRFDEMASEHFKLGYFDVQFHMRKPEINHLGHKISRFKDNRKT